MLLLDEKERRQDDGGNGDVELLHEQCRQQRKAAEPVDIHLLALPQPRPVDCRKQPARQEQKPQQHAGPLRENGERSDDQGEKRAVMVHVIILCRVGGIERRAVDGMPEHSLEDEKVVVAAVQFQHPRQRQHRPQSQQHTTVGEQGVTQNSFDFIVHYR